MKVKELLSGCSCGNACHKCLKHYRNQYVHGLLDRFAALDLLNWGMNGTITKQLSPDEQKKYIDPLSGILNRAGCRITFDSTGIIANKKTHTKKVVVYPAMWKEPRQDETIFVSDAYIKYAKPYAVQKILDEI